MWTNSLEILEGLLYLSSILRIKLWKSRKCDTGNKVHNCESWNRLAHTKANYFWHGLQNNKRKKEITLVNCGETSTEPYRKQRTSILIPHPTQKNFMLYTLNYFKTKIQIYKYSRRKNKK